MTTFMVPGLVKRWWSFACHYIQWHRSSVLTLVVAACRWLQKWKCQAGYGKVVAFRLIEPLDHRSHPELDPELGTEDI